MKTNTELQENVMAVINHNITSLDDKIMELQKQLQEERFFAHMITLHMDSVCNAVRQQGFAITDVMHNGVGKLFVVCQPTAFKLLKWNGYNSKGQVIGRENAEKKAEKLSEKIARETGCVCHIYNGSMFNDVNTVIIYITLK